MEYLDLENYLLELSNRESPEVVNARIAQHEFPDLRAFKDPNGRIRYCSAIINPYADQVDINHDSEGNIYVMPFLINKKVQIFSDPPVIMVGEHNTNGFGEIPDPGWEDWLLEEKIDKELIKKVKDFFAKHAVASW